MATTTRWLVTRLSWLGIMLWSMSAHAVLTIEITQGVEAGLPIAVVPFGGEAGKPGQGIADIVEADLMRSGRFNALPRKDFLGRPHTDAEVKFKDWRLLKSEALVVGKMQPAGGRHQVQFQLLDVFKGTQLTGFRYTVPADKLRTVAHQIADVIYEKLMGEPGAFNTRIAYVTVERKQKRPKFLLQVADSDGYNARTILESWEPLMSPAWAPDGNRLAYVSFEGKRSMIFVQNLVDGKRTKVADFTGINSAPAWAPDGTRLAITLSRDGNPEIYVLDLQTKALTRLTQHASIDTEPAWSPDGRHLVFTSDRSGRPQLYRMAASGGNAERLTFDGDYNARGSYSADGKLLTLVTRANGNYKIAAFNLESRALQVLTDTTLDESPSFAPNARMILYATERQGRGVLAAVSSDGRVKQVLKLLDGDVREPAWSPLNRKL